MRGHFFIINSANLAVVDRTSTHGVYKESGEGVYHKKTRADILADLSCLRIGDRLFFYNDDTQVFHGVYEVTSELFESSDDLGHDKFAPYRIKVHKLLPLQNTISEHNLLARQNAARDFRSIFFKKTLQRGKACTHLFPDETKALTEVMLMQNDTIPDEQHATRPEKVTPMIPKFGKKGSECEFEKELEWWLTHHIDRHPECQKIFGHPESIEMFANYIPINVAGGNIDLVVYHRREIAGVSVRNKISIVELKKGKANNRALAELENYTRSFIQHVIDFEGADVIQPIIIANDFTKEVVKACEYWNLCARKPLLFKYAATSDTEIKFSRVGASDE